MELALAILMVLGIFVAIPAAIGFAIVGAFILRERRGYRAERARAIAGKRSFQVTMLGLMLLYYPIVYYFGEIVDHFGWEALRWEFFYTVHDIHRVFFLIPIIYAGYCFRIKGAIISTIFALAIFIPRGLLLSPYPDPMNRMLVFIIFAFGLGIFIAIMRNRIEKLQYLIDYKE